MKSISVKRGRHWQRIGLKIGWIVRYNSGVKQYDYKE